MKRGPKKQTDIIHEKNIYETLNEGQKKHYVEFKDILHARFDDGEGSFCGPLPRNEDHALEIAKQIYFAEKKGFKFDSTYQMEFLDYPKITQWNEEVHITESKKYIDAQAEIEFLKAKVERLEKAQCTK
jgi:hypothetical protein